MSDDAGKVECDLADSQVAPPARAKAAKLSEAARLMAAAMYRLRASSGDPRLAARLSALLKQAQAALDSV